jgi:hypothetical protein
MDESKWLFRFQFHLIMLPILVSFFFVQLCWQYP